MDSIWVIAIIVVISVSSGLLFNSWMASKTRQKKKTEILGKMVSKVEASYREQFIKKNTEAVKRTLNGKFSLFLRGNPYRIDGIGEAMKWLEQAMTELQTMSVHNQAVQLLSEDVALITFTFTGKGLRADKPFEGTGKTTHVWIRDKMKGWTLIHEHTSYN